MQNYIDGLVKYGSEEEAMDQLLPASEATEYEFRKIKMVYVNKRGKKNEYRYNVATFCKKYTVDKNTVIEAVNNNWFFMRIGDMMCLHKKASIVIQLGIYSSFIRDEEW